MLLLFFSLLFANGSGLKTVTTSYGKVRGVTDFINQKDQKYTFKGVPFAKPPLGSLRFALPQDPDPWSNVLDASKYSPACLSNSSMTSTPQKFISEDCLYINIFTSQNCLINKCPVIVYYHGGSFNLDSATMFPDRFIKERYVEKGIVFVIPAYRLGVFGQFYLGNNDVLPTNLLIYDCVQALNYVNKEISNFGGNPDDVTLMGHSSGGQLVNSIGFSNIIDPGRKLFHKFIVLSSHGMFGFEELQKQNSFEIAKRFNCVSEIVEDIVDCMRKIDALDILQAQKSMEENDNRFFKSLIQAPPLMNFNEKISEFKTNAPARKMLCGVTEHEFEKFKYVNYYVTAKFLDFDNPVETVMAYRNNFTNKTQGLVNSDSSSVFVSAATYSEALVNAGGEVWLFETKQKPYSMHVSDMQYFIGIHREKVHTSDMDILDSFYSKLLVNFTKYGEPSPTWEKLDTARMNFLVLEIDSENDVKPKMEEGFHEELVDFWLIDMMELDRNITEQKKSIGKQEDKTTIGTVTTITSPKIHKATPFPIHRVTEPTPNAYSEPNSQESFLIYKQWWFYAIIILSIGILIVIFVICRAPSREEYPPLLSQQ